MSKSYFSTPYPKVTDLKAEQILMEQTTATSHDVSQYLQAQTGTDNRQYLSEATIKADFVNWKRGNAK
jgi:hypothetical protein